MNKFWIVVVVLGWSAALSIIGSTVALTVNAVAGRHVHTDSLHMDVPSRLVIYSKDVQEIRDGARRACARHGTGYMILLNGETPDPEYLCPDGASFTDGGLRVR